MRAFVLIRQYALSHQDLTLKLFELEAKFEQQFNNVYEALKFLMDKDQIEPEQINREKIEYKLR